MSVYRSLDCWKLCTFLGLGYLFYRKLLNRSHDLHRSESLTKWISTRGRAISRSVQDIDKQFVHRQIHLWAKHECTCGRQASKFIREAEKKWGRWLYVNVTRVPSRNPGGLTDQIFAVGAPWIIPFSSGGPSFWRVKKKTHKVKKNTTVLDVLSLNLPSDSPKITEDEAWFRRSWKHMQSTK